MVLLPTVYACAILYYRCYFIKEENKIRKPFHSWQEFVVLILSEGAIWRLWQSFGRCSVFYVPFLLLVIMLYGMTILCMSDYWERVVPNRILLLLLLLWILIIGLYGVHDLNALARHMFSVVLGVVFCMFTFGFCYLVSRGSLGAGDVKLSFLMGLYLTGEYVVGAVFYGCVASACFSIALLLMKKITRKDSIPFVPFLYLGVIVRYFIG